MTKNFAGKLGDSTIKQNSLLQEFSVPLVGFGALQGGATFCIISQTYLIIISPQLVPCTGGTVLGLHGTHFRRDLSKLFLLLKAFSFPPFTSNLSNALKAQGFILHNCKLPTSLTILRVFNMSSFQTSRKLLVKLDMSITFSLSNPFIPG